MRSGGRECGTTEGYHTEKGIVFIDTNYKTARSKSARCKGFLGPNLHLNLFCLPPPSRLLGGEGLLQLHTGKYGKLDWLFPLLPSRSVRRVGKASQSISAQTTTFLRQQWVARPWDPVPVLSTPIW